MKKNVLVLAALSFFIASCNSSETKDTVEIADSTNNEHADQNPAAINTDQSTTDFLVKAADGGLAETDAGKVAQQKATNAAVKRFADMMVMDHTGANQKVMALASARNVTLPTAPSDEHQKAAAKVSEKSGKDFDKAYMDMMVKDHENTIDLFEKSSNDSKDEEVRSFINMTLPTLKMHLDSARAIRKGLK